MKSCKDCGLSQYCVDLVSISLRSLLYRIWRMEAVSTVRAGLCRGVYPILRCSYHCDLLFTILSVVVTLVLDKGCDIRLILFTR